MHNKLPKNLSQHFLSFIETHPSQQFSNSLRRMLIDYMAYGVNVGLHIHFDRLLLALNDLFDLLDIAEEYREKISLKVEQSSRI